MGPLPLYHEAGNSGYAVVQSAGQFIADIGK
jgi:hypothetical protein